MSRTRAASSILVSLTMLLAACGGGSGGSTDVQSIETLIERHYAQPSCGDLTDSGRTAFGHPTDDASCATDIKKQAPKDVTVSDVMVDGDQGTAVADNFTFKVVKVNGDWKIDGGA